MKIDPFPGTLTKQPLRHNSMGYVLTDEQRAWLGKWFPEEENSRLMAASGMSHSTLHRFAREFGLTKSPKGIKRVRIVETTGDELVAVKRTDIDIDSAEGRRMALLDNLTTQVNLAWDPSEIEAVSSEIEGFDPSDYGFDPSQLEVAGMGDETTPAKQTEVKEDDFDPDAHYETKVKHGEVWQLGNHRLMCGDSTSADDVARLMNGERADMIFLDPPYDLDYNIDIPITFCAENAAIFLMTSEKNLIKQTYNHLDIFSRMFAVDFRVPNMIANNQCMTRVDFVSYFSIGKSKFNNMHDAFHTLIECFKKHGVNYSQNYGHPQAKNVKLSATFIEHYTMQNEVVLDMFGGSGSTMIACEQLGRKARMMEMDEKYCDIIVARWEQFTGKTAVRI